MKHLALALSILMITGCAQATQYRVQPQPVAQPEPYPDFRLPYNMPEQRGSKIRDYARNEKLAYKAAKSYEHLTTPVKQWICRYDNHGITELYYFKFMEMLNGHPSYAVKVHRKFDHGKQGHGYAFGLMIEDANQISLISTWESDTDYNQRARHIDMDDWQGLFYQEWQEKTGNKVESFNAKGRCAFKNNIKT